MNVPDGTLRWVDFDKAHRGDIEAFRCTTPKPRDSSSTWRQIPHPRPWELLVQAGIHVWRSPRPGVTYKMGFDQDGLAVVAIWEREGGPGDYKVIVIAQALRLRSSDNSPSGIADEALDFAISIMLAEAVAQGAAELSILATIHKSNRASQALFARHGFEPEPASADVFFVSDEHAAGDTQEWLRVDALR